MPVINPDKRAIPWLVLNSRNIKIPARREIYTGAESLIGHSADVVTPMKRNEKGFVMIDGVQWAAINIGIDVNRTEKVVIIERKGLTLIIKKI